MKIEIVTIKRLDWPLTITGARHLAEFTVRIADGFMIAGWRLMRQPNGRLKVSPPPMKDAGRVTLLSPEVRFVMINRALAAYKALGGVLDDGAEIGVDNCGRGIFDVSIQEVG